MNGVIVTTSWDDGHTMDRRLADLLAKYDLPATFYIAPQNREFSASKRLQATDITHIASRFEVGSHTLTHPILSSLSPDELNHELVASKGYLSDCIGKPVQSFCYPRGRYTDRVVAGVRNAGYTYARTTKRYATTIPADPLMASTTLEAHRNPIPTTARDILRTERLLGAHGAAIRAVFNWEILALRTFDLICQRGGVFHIWGHSWVVDASADWDRLERVLRYISHHSGVSYMTNQELLTAGSEKI